MDTRTPRDLSVPEPALNSVKVPCDPAQVIVNHASFRVQLPTSSPVSSAVRVPAPAGRRRPLVWTGRSAPGNPGATALVRAVQNAASARVSSHAVAPDAVATQVLPRVEPRAAGLIGEPRAPQPGEVTQPLPTVPPSPFRHQGDDPEEPAAQTRAARRRARPGDGRQAFHPDRRMNLGLVLLPLRILLGFITLYAGMGKLTDPVYFDGGERGSLYSWLSSLESWSLASPLHHWAMSHPVGAGLTVAFTQIIVGVLTIFGLWQRLAAALGALLSLTLLVTVSWRNGPAYDTPDVIFFVAWNPLIIAGAPVYSLDARLAGEAWRKLGPRAPVGELRRRVLRRGSMLAALLLGLALLIGSILGGAVRSSNLPRLPGPGEPPSNHLPGERLPEDSAQGNSSSSPTQVAKDDEGTAGDPASGAPGAAAASSAPSSGGTGGGAGTAPEQAPVTEQTVPAPQPTAAAPQTEPQESEPQEVAPPSSGSGGSGGGSGGSGGSGGGSPAGNGGETADEGGDQSSLGPIGGLLG